MEAIAGIALLYYHLYLTMGLGLDEDDDSKKRKTDPRDDPYFRKALDVLSLQWT